MPDKEPNEAAQFCLGNLYRNGQGTTKELSQSIKWTRAAAEQGFPEAQYNLGTMYRDGEGAPQDFVRAHMWFNLAAASGRMAQASTGRDELATRMTSDQIAEAQ